MSGTPIKFPKSLKLSQMTPRVSHPLTPEIVYLSEAQAGGISAIQPSIEHLKASIIDQGDPSEVRLELEISQRSFFSQTGKVCRIDEVRT